MDSSTRMPWGWAYRSSSDCLELWSRGKKLAGIATDVLVRVPERTSYLVDFATCRGLRPTLDCQQASKFLRSCGFKANTYLGSFKPRWHLEARFLHHVARDMEPYLVMDWIWDARIRERKCPGIVRELQDRGFNAWASDKFVEFSLDNEDCYSAIPLSLSTEQILKEADTMADMEESLKKVFRGDPALGYKFDVSCPPVAECPECWGTGHVKGYGGPCPRGCRR